MNRPMIVLVCLGLIACGGSSPTAPSPVTPPVTVAPPVVTPPAPPPVVTPPPVLPAFPPNDPRFDLAYYRKLVHNAYQLPLYASRRFSQAPRIYLRTVDEDGKPIDARMLDDTAKALEESAGEMTGKFGLAGLERGTGTRYRHAGWLTVRWLPQASNPERICGRSYIGVEGEHLDLFPYQSGCGCDRYGIAPRVVRHELGHALGFFHTDDPRDLMYGPRYEDRATWEAWRPACDLRTTNQERYHMGLAYDRPIGSAAP